MELTGTTWNHTRGFTSIVAASQRYEELNGEPTIRWDKRSLQAFADEPIGGLAERYDLLVIDHPWTGHAARHGLLLPLDEVLPRAVIEDQRSSAVGPSFESYTMRDALWALPMDAATPVASFRPDLFVDGGSSLPETWNDLVALARRGLVAFPSIPQDTLMNFYMVCSTLGEDPCSSPEAVISRDVGRRALEMLRELAAHIPERAFHWNPIATYEAMTSGDEIAYCPFAYGYVNYSVAGYARRRLRFTDTVRLTDGGMRLRTTLGGTGLAISAATRHREHAARFVEYMATAATQRNIFYRFGGQPGHRSVWTDDHANRETLDFFSATLPTIERSFLRPRYAGHMYFQDNAGAPIREYLMHGGDTAALLDTLDALYRDSVAEPPA